MPAEGETEVVFLDVGQGDAVLILQNGAACLIDAGPKDARQNLVQDLRSYGVSPRVSKTARGLAPS